MTSPEQTSRNIIIPGSKGDWEYVASAIVGAFQPKTGQMLIFTRQESTNIRDSDLVSEITKFYSASPNNKGGFESDGLSVAVLNYSEGLFNLNYEAKSFDPTKMSFRNFDQTIMLRRLQDRRY